MDMYIFPCSDLANKIQEKCFSQSEKFLKNYSRSPALAVLLVGKDPASKIYVNRKKEACTKCGIKGVDIELDSNINEQELIEKIKKLNEDPNIDGILVQSPLPDHINENVISSTIHPAKDVDCFHPVNVGRFYLDTKGAIENWIAPCTPLGVLAVLEENNISMKGKHAVVIGRSSIVGKPMAQILLSRDATVTLCHSHTKGIKEISKKADILVSAVGKPGIIIKEHIMPGASIIDVGISRSENAGIQGDVDVDSVSSKASFLTPVPGGIGPMTIAMLMKNTIRLAFSKKATGN